MTDIMLVDDEVLALEYLKNMVDWERNGYHVVGCATSGKKALELFDRTHPQIVISDIRMPGTDGLELTRQIKEKDKEPVVILLSAYRDFDYAQKGIRYGVSNYLLKHELSSELILKELEEVKEKLERAGNKKKIYLWIIRNSFPINCNYWSEICSNEINGYDKRLLHAISAGT